MVAASEAGDEPVRIGSDQSISVLYFVSECSRVDLRT